ncbi:Elongation factor P C-terminal family protein [Babesia bovis T2Bo]|uniref:Elongation factor P C-terminal family protein n=1 Tax=Babesia bovis T2Bo TaxID=484906 RepID=UPI001D68718C|nr:Elongation factor P C-terminal family protein [Babesia bovis T2Bo]EDO07197.2 Elongation factor P C-terminal family protein [Babesia bovis T2Bo]
MVHYASKWIAISFTLRWFTLFLILSTANAFYGDRTNSSSSRFLSHNLVNVSRFNESKAKPITKMDSTMAVGQSRLPLKRDSFLYASRYKNIDPSIISPAEKRKIRDMIMEGGHVKLIEQVLKNVNLDRLYKKPAKSRVVPTSTAYRPILRDTRIEDDVKDDAVDPFSGERDVEEPTHINKIRASTFVIHRGDVHLVLSSQHISQARSRGHYKVKMRNLMNNKEIVHSFSDGSKLSVVAPNKISATYQGTEDRSGDFIFQCEKGEMHLPKSSQLQAIKYLKPELKVTISTWKGQIIGIFVPHQIQYKVIRINVGNYAATLENGLVILVPTYVKPGDYIDVNTSKGEFLRRSVIG